MTIKKVYICSQFRTDSNKNIMCDRYQAEQYCKYAVEQGVLPIAPSICLSRFCSKQEYEDRLLSLMDVCKEVWVFNPNNELTAIMKDEIAAASRLHIPVVFKQWVVT